MTLFVPLRWPTGHVTVQLSHDTVKEEKEGRNVWVNITRPFSNTTVTAVSYPLSGPRWHFSPLLVVAGLSPSSSRSSLRLHSPSKVPSKSGNVGIFEMPGNRDRRTESCLLSILQNGQKKLSTLGCSRSERCRFWLTNKTNPGDSQISFTWHGHAAARRLWADT